MLTSLLWLDDDEELIDSSTPVFTKYGFRIYKACTVSTALAILRETKVNGILLDKRLAGGENGIELANTLQQHYPQTKIVIFTAFPEFDEHVEADEVGISYLEKIEKSIPPDQDKRDKFFRALHLIFDELSPGRQELGQSQEAGIVRQGFISENRNLTQVSLLFVFVFLTIVLCVWLLVEQVPAYVFPLTVIACIVLYAVVAASIMRATGQLSEKGFLQLMLEAFKVVLRARDVPKRGKPGS